MAQLISTVFPGVLYQLAFNAGVKDRSTGQTIKTFEDFKSQMIGDPTMDVIGAYRSYRNGFIRIPTK
jgi:hypothetical protein